METGWFARARCKEMNPEIFFPSDGIGVQIAQRICAECPVTAECLEYALEGKVEHGVWGGASERQRRRILRGRRMARRNPVSEPVKEPVGS